MCYSILIEQDLKRLEVEYDAKIDYPAFDRYQKMTQRDPKRFKTIAENPRIYPNYFSPIIAIKGQNRVILPMRYRIRPYASPKEVPSKYNMFNARVDSLMSRPSWQPLFMKNHGIVPLKGFYEWVAAADRKKVIFFELKTRNLIHTPVIFDTWVSPDRSEGFASFAVVTRAPPQEVVAAGHDRCPIALNKESIEAWLNPVGDPSDMISMIDQPSRGALVYSDSIP